MSSTGWTDSSGQSSNIWFADPTDVRTTTIGGGSVIPGVRPTDVITSPSGDVQLGGTGISIDPIFTKSDQLTADMLTQIGATSGNPQANMSLNDMVAEVMIMTLQHAQEMKSIEREMKAELAQIQFQNGMKIADLIREKGELAYKKAVTEAVGKLVSTAVNIGLNKLAEHMATPSKAERSTVKINTDVSPSTAQISTDKNGMPGSATTPDMAPGSTTEVREVTDRERAHAQRQGELAGSLGSGIVDCVCGIVAANFDLEISKIDAEIKVHETMNKLVDNIISSVDASIHSAESLKQFCLNMISQMANLTHDAFTKIAGNIR
ncbi:MAG: hypothetical protein LBN94_03260 [Puniceicoccales bacterium]|jgi:hypothetical protein|nr:hypothetical protein [Puniceicoccales bacterium]